MAGDDDVRSDARTRLGEEGHRGGGDLGEVAEAEREAAGGRDPGDRPGSAADAVDASGAPRGAGGGLAAPDGGVTGGTADGPAERREANADDGSPLLEREDAGSAAGFSSDDRADDPNRRGEGFSGAGGGVPG